MDAVADDGRMLREEQLDYPYYWRVRTRLADRFGQHCRVLCRGAKNSCAVEFDDGYRVVTSRWFVRRLT